jgi:hypothetical protein
MNAKARLTASDDLAGLNGVSNNVMDLLDAAVRGYDAKVSAETLGECFASKMCDRPTTEDDPDARSISLDTGEVAKVIITQKGLDCHAAFAA